MIFILSRRWILISACCLDQYCHLDRINIILDMTSSNKFLMLCSSCRAMHPGIVSFDERIYSIFGYIWISCQLFHLSLDYPALHLLYFTFYFLLPLKFNGSSHGVLYRSPCPSPVPLPVAIILLCDEYPSVILFMFTLSQCNELIEHWLLTAEYLISSRIIIRVTDNL